MSETEKQQPLGAGGKPGESGRKDEAKGESKPTRYRILWGKMPDPESDEGPKRPTYREILNPKEEDGA